MKARGGAELMVGALFAGAGLVVIYAIATWITALVRDGHIFRGEVWLSGVVGPLSVFIVPLAIAGLLVERGAGGTATRAVDGLRTVAILFVLACAGFTFVTTSGVLSPRQPLIGSRMLAGAAGALVALAPPAAILVGRDTRIVRGVGFAASLMFTELLGLAGAFPAASWIAVRLAERP